MLKIRNSEYGIKHAILDIYIEQFVKSDAFKTGEIFALQIIFILESIKNKELRNKVNRCIKSLCVTKHLDYLKKDEVEYIAISKKGLDTYNSEEFITLENEERRKVINNRYTIAFGVITAFGVLFAILKDFLFTKDAEKHEIKIIIQQPLKTKSSNLDSTESKFDTIIPLPITNFKK